MQKIIASIVTWNSASSIQACITSVLGQSYSELPLIVVDNNSADDTCDIVESFKDPRITLIRLKENTGFCGGHNYSIGHTDSEFVLLVNPDIVMMPDYVENALGVIEKDKKNGTVCGLLLQGSSQDPNVLIDSAGLNKKRSGIMQMRMHEQKKSECTLIEERVFGADGALPLYRRSMIKDISYQGQFFDELFFAHKEDWDISWRSHIYGWKTIFSPLCVATHPRHFKPKSLAVRTHIAGHIKVHSVKNQLILLLKNEKFSDFIINGIFILPRQILIFGYILLFERTSLQAYRFVMSNYKSIMEKRRVIQQRASQ